MPQSILPRGTRTLDGVSYIGIYLPVLGKGIIARKSPVSNGFDFDYYTAGSLQQYEDVWKNPLAGVFLPVTEVDANMAVLCNQLSATSASNPLTDAQLRAAPVHVILDNPTTAATPTGPATVHVDNFPATVTVANPTTAPETGLAKNTTLTDGSQKTQVTNFPATWAVTGPATDAQLRAAPLPVTFSFPATQAISGTVTVANPVTTVAVSNFPAAATSLSVSNFPTTQAVSGVVSVSNFPAAATTIAVSNFPATQPVSLAANTPDVTDRAARLLGHVTVDNQPTTLAVSNFPATQAVSGTVGISGTVPVSGPLTDTQLRATPVAVTGFPATQQVAGTFFQTTQPVSGPLTDTQLRATPVPVSGFPTTYPVTGTFYQATQPVSAATLPLPTGASTAALQTSGNTLLQTIATNTTNGPKVSGGLASRVVVANAASTTPTVIKASAGQLYHLGIGNTSAAVVYVSIFNKATAPAAGDIPSEIHPIPAGQYVSIDYALGNQYTTGISLTITSNVTLLGVLTGLLAANQVCVNVAFQ